MLAPGDRAHAVRAQSLAKGMFIDDGLWADLQKLAAEASAETRKEKILMTHLFGALRLPARFYSAPASAPPSA